MVTGRRIARPWVAGQWIAGRRIAGLVGVVLVCGGCSPDAGSPAAAANASATSTPASTSTLPSTSTPAPTATTSGPLSVAAYQGVLARIEATMRRNLTRAMAAKSIASANAYRELLTAVIAQQAVILRLVDPPPRLAAVHEDALQTLSGSLIGDLLNSPVDGCTVAEPLATFIYFANLDIYDAITQGMNPTGRRTTFGRKLLPAPPRMPAPRRGTNGHVVQRVGKRGSAQIRVTNKRSTDALIVVSTSGKTQASMYLRAKSTATLTGLRGSLGIAIRTGSDWDAAARGFTRGCEEETFTEPLDRGYDWQFAI
ncbi:hypothetical protein OHA70_17085 [Kribbella sp. NBC_00382]|uniref:hypothetical protein n=1 Tax=Kribbella sp. NBC_00382 TaxID=2975967 RepID=UPI002E1FFD32